MSPNTTNDDEPDELELLADTLGVQPVSHAHSMRPWYERENPTNEHRFIRNWDADGTWANGEVAHESDRSFTPRSEIYPLVFDIESTAETPQRPILATAYDHADGIAWVATDKFGKFRRDGETYSTTASELKAMVRERFESNGWDVNEVRSHAMNDSWFSRILNHATRDDGVERVLVGHNVFYDLGMLGTENDWRLEQGKDSAHEWDGVIEYSDGWSCLHKRAGANGRIYSFRQHHAPVPLKVCDTQTVAKATRMSAGLESLAGDLDDAVSRSIEYSEPDDLTHGELTDEYVEYNVDDVAATLECYFGLEEYTREAFGTDLPLHKFYSSASVAKDALRRMGYDRVHYSEDAMDIAATAYFGGQTEALRPAELIEDVTMVDFLSQYPTASALLRVWEFMQAERVTVETASVSDLPHPSRDDFRDGDTWAECANYYVSVTADGATLPVRVEDEHTETTRVHNGEVHHAPNEATTYHYLDVLGAILRDEGDIEIHAAWEMQAHGRQELSPAEIGGTEIPADANVMVKGIEERKRIQAKLGGKNARTLGLKIVSNSQYGVSAERLVKIAAAKDEQDIKREQDVAGTYYNPHVAAAITAAGRFMLTLGELEAQANGGEMYYCDTDSLVVDDHVADEVIEFFDDLNPYEGAAGEQPFLEIEDGKLPNWDAPKSEWDGVDLRSVNMFQVGVKKYAMVDDEGHILKHTEHGLGHFENLRSEKWNADEQDEPPEQWLRVRKFWATLLDRPEFDADLHWSERQLPRSVLSEVVRWQVAATTYRVRKLMSQLVTGGGSTSAVRYGDFVRRTIIADSADVSVQYLGLDLNERAVKITESRGAVHAEVVDGMDEHLRDQKQVRHVLADWSMKAQQRDAGRPAFYVTGEREVTKEAADVTMAWDDKMTLALEQVNFGSLF